MTDCSPLCNHSLSGPGPLPHSCAPIRAPVPNPVQSAAPLYSAPSTPATTHHRNSRPMPRFRRLLRWALIAFAAAVLLGGLALATLYFVVSAKLPDVQTLRHVEMQEPMYVYARDRSEERSGGKECVSPWRSRWSQ